MCARGLGTLQFALKWRPLKGRHFLTILRHLSQMAGWAGQSEFFGRSYNWRCLLRVRNRGWYQCRRLTDDDRWLEPTNPFLAKYKNFTHVSWRVCTNSHRILRYCLAYMCKNDNLAQFQTVVNRKKRKTQATNTEGAVDEIQTYREERVQSAMHHAWRLRGYPLLSDWSMTK